MPVPSLVRRFAGVLVAAALATTLTPTGAAAFTTSSGVRLDAVEARLLTLINQARTSRGIPALALAPGYTDVARRWSASQSARNTMAHNPNLASHVRGAGGGNWRAVAENVGRGYGTRADALFNAYMNSAGHRGNILSRSYRYIGIGWAERPDGYGFNTQVFVDTYSSAYGRTREPAYGGVADRRSYTATGVLADFERNWDQRLSTAVHGSGLWAGGLSVEPAGTGDQSARFTVRESRAGTGGHGEMRLRDAADLSRATALRVRIAASTGSRKPVVVEVWARREFGDAIRLGAVTASMTTATVSFTLPAGAKSMRNQLAFVVTRNALVAMSPSSTSSRWATVLVRDVSVVV